MSEEQPPLASAGGLQFAGTYTISKNSGGFGLNSSLLGGFVANRPVVYGNTFTVNSPTVIEEISVNTFQIAQFRKGLVSVPPDIPIAIFSNPEEDPLVTGKVTMIKAIPHLGLLGSPVPAKLKPYILLPGYTYTLVWSIVEGHQVYTSGPVVNNDNNFTWGTSTISGDADDAFALNYPPNTLPYVEWTPDLMKCKVALNDTQTIPPEPLIAPQTLGFVLALNKNWMPANAVDWELQFSRSSDGIEFKDWFTLSVAPIEQTVVTHANLDPYDDPYYRYRYRVTTDKTISEWSEELYAGPVRTLVANSNLVNYDPGAGIPDLDLPDNTISAKNLNVETLSAITANLGTVTAGVVRGPLIETSATNPRIYLQQGVGLVATNNLGQETFKINAVSGNVTVKGDITGSSFKTGVSPNARVEVDDDGIRGFAFPDVPTFNLDATDGSLTLLGVIETSDGSDIHGEHITPLSIDATRINVGTLSAISANLGTVTAGAINGTTITGATIRSSATDSTNARFTSTGLRLPTSSSNDPGFATAARIDWTNTTDDLVGKISSSQATSGQYMNLSVYEVAGETAYQEMTMAVRDSGGGLSSNISQFRQDGLDSIIMRLNARQPSDTGNQGLVQLQIDTGTGDFFSIYTTNGGTSYVGQNSYGNWLAYSDEGMKKDITKSNAGLEVTKGLSPKSYKLKDTGQEEIGLIAQNVEQVLPHAVYEAELRLSDGTTVSPGKAISLSQLIALGVQTDIELDARIDALEARLDILEGN